MAQIDARPKSTRIYGFGSNGAGQLGVGHQDDLSQPEVCRIIDSDDKHHMFLPDQADVKKVVAGGNHTVILTDQHKIFAAGNNHDGRCGIAPDDNTNRLTCFTAVGWARNRYITHVAAAWEASIFVESGRTVWVCGSGQKGELGLGEAIDKSLTPRMVFDVDEMVGGGRQIVDIASGVNHIVVLLSDDTIYGWGSCRKGQLGEMLRPSKVCWQPQRLNIPIRLSKPTHIAVGREFTLLTDTENTLVLLGELKVSEGSPSLEKVHVGATCLAGWSTIYVFQEGSVQGQGMGRRGQLPPLPLPMLTGVAAGSEHCLALTKHGKVIAWGWGEHGNCGLPCDERGIVCNRFNTIAVTANGLDNIVGVGAGCATSFIWACERA